MDGVRLGYFRIVAAVLRFSLVSLSLSSRSGLHPVSTGRPRYSEDVDELTPIRGAPLAALGLHWQLSLHWLLSQFSTSESRSSSLAVSVAAPNLSYHSRSLWSPVRQPRHTPIYPSTHPPIHLHCGGHAIHPSAPASSGVLRVLRCFLCLSSCPCPSVFFGLLGTSLRSPVRRPRHTPIHGHRSHGGLATGRGADPRHFDHALSTSYSSHHPPTAPTIHRHSSHRRPSGQIPGPFDHTFRPKSAQHTAIRKYTAPTTPPSIRLFGCAPLPASGYSAVHSIRLFGCTQPPASTPQHTVTRLYTARLYTAFGCTQRTAIRLCTASWASIHLELPRLPSDGRGGGLDPHEAVDLDAVRRLELAPQLRQLRVGTRSRVCVCV